MTVLDSFSLTGKTAVVTGGNRGLGLAFTRALAEAGARVVILARDEARSAEVAPLLAEEGLDVGSVTADVTDRDALTSATEAVVAEHGRIDVLVNNAGICIHKPAAEVDPQEWQDVVDVNLTGVWNGCQIVGRHMIAAGGGVIVNIGSMSADIVNRPQWQPAYNASKAAVHHLSRSLAAEWAPHNIRVNALAPGYVRTDMSPIDRPEFRRYWIEDAPQQRAATPEEIAPALLFLASDASAFVTGSVLTIDGGYSVF